jgi:hypothetical protein
MNLPPLFSTHIPEWVGKAAKDRIDHWDARRSTATNEKKVLAVVAEYMAQVCYGVIPAIDVRVNRRLYYYTENGILAVDEEGTHRPDFMHNGIPHDVKNANSVNQDELLAYPEGSRIVRVWQLKQSRTVPGEWSARIGWLPVKDILAADIKWLDDRAGRGNKFAYISGLQWLTPEL